MVNTSLNVLNKFNLKKNEYYLIVGRLIPDNNSKLIIEGFLKSKSNKKIVVVGDVPYNDYYTDDVKLSSNKVLFTGYIRDQFDLSALYTNCFGYVHGHQYGGTNPTMINALYLNCQILALDTAFNREMLENKESILFNKKSISNKFNEFEEQYIELTKKSINYKTPKKYDWDFITNQYLDVFYSLTNYQNK